MNESKEKALQFEAPEKTEKIEKIEKIEKTERNGRADAAEKAEKTSRSVGSEKGHAKAGGSKATAGIEAEQTAELLSKSDKTARTTVSPAVVRRLPRYFRYLRELLGQGILRISSAELCKMMNITASQIRQDLNCFGGFGQQGYGYNVRYLYSKIGDILGVANKYTAVIIGAGNLGAAIAGSTMFEKRSILLAGLFDTSFSVIGSKVSGYTVRDISEIEKFLDEIHVDIAIMTLPKEQTNAMAQRLAAAGVRGFWNFTNAQIDRDKYDVVVENVHMGDSLMQLMYELNDTPETDKGE